ncbi:hypothetical protein RRG08_022797 [Elysia crispata]|uniref:Uncharacterized protein n=1 Tax=Elysia crispata TaxID=231223 RepID=A0AAE0Z276_9GAST|nr:hypothetical protein RRG08_022797 [Elysia crispata]
MPQWSDKCGARGADERTGVINRAENKAVSSGRLTVRNAEDLHTWCSKELTRREQPSLRDFFLVPRETVRLVGRRTPPTCACKYCLSLRFKNEVLNKTMSSNLEGFRMPLDTKMLDLLQCEKKDSG